jgi:hypothetical protein
MNIGVLPMPQAECADLQVIRRLTPAQAHRLIHAMIDWFDLDHLSGFIQSHHPGLSFPGESASGGQGRRPRFVNLDTALGRTCTAKEKGRREAGQKG